MASPSSIRIQTGNKKRAIYLAAALLAVMTGLAIRAYASALSTFLADHAGDALWAMKVYFGCRFFLVYKKIRLAASLSLLFCFSVEFSQLYQAEWINQFRETTVGALILGHGFLLIDLLRYAAGIGIAAALDKAVPFILNVPVVFERKKR
ncbi:DUF2809 domain-containing protein [Planococcus sp. YIM B11945]|uniref:ribosomal maturation YjgA family protein n=1 Tax=Planococcus sp. YIM B11945 TaxID=3435410 RepID=UPI003D7D8679